MGKYKRRVAEKPAKEKKKTNMQLMILLVSAVMLLSGFYMFTERSSEPGGSVELPEFETYEVSPLGNGSVMVVLTEKTNVLAALPKLGVDYETINNILNETIDGVDRISVESTPSFIAFRVSTNSENGTAGAKEIMDKTMKAYTLFRVYKAKLPSGILIGDIEVFGSLNRTVNESIAVLLSQKTKDNQPVGFIGFEQLVPKDNIPATVVSVSNVNLRGVLESWFDETVLEGIIDSDIKQPQIVLNEPPSDSLVKKLNITEEDNKTWFHPLSRNVSEILDKENVSYTMGQGSISLLLSLDSDTDALTKTLADNSVENITLAKNGFVSLPEEVILYNQLVRIENNENFTAYLDFDTEVGNNITVSITAIQFGEQVIPISATETNA